jgi:two-component system C4-dicarboxylate transport sensor histidine kinase DctB
MSARPGGAPLEIALVTAVAVAGLCALACAGLHGLARRRAAARALASRQAALESEREAELEARAGARLRAQEARHRAEQLAAIGRFAAGVAHQVNGPVAAVGASLRFLREVLEPGTPAPPDAAVAVHEAETALARVSAVARQLRDASRLAELPARTDAAAEVDRAAREAVEVARTRGAAAALRELPVDLAIPAGLWVAAEPDLVIEVLAHLVANALDAVAASGARVRLSAEVRGAHVEIAVEDGGPGIGPEVRRRLFEPFVTTKTHAHACGLGLAVSRGLVASAGGELELESDLGRGTRAVVRLGAAEPPPIPPALTPPPGRW